MNSRKCLENLVRTLSYMNNAAGECQSRDMQEILLLYPHMCSLWHFREVLQGGWQEDARSNICRNVRSYIQPLRESSGRCVDCSACLKTASVRFP